MHFYHKSVLFVEHTVGGFHQILWMWLKVRKMDKLHKSTHLHCLQFEQSLNEIVFNIDGNKVHKQIKAIVVIFHHSTQHKHTQIKRLFFSVSLCGKQNEHTKKTTYFLLVHRQQPYNNNNKQQWTATYEPTVAKNQIDVIYGILKRFMKTDFLSYPIVIANTFLYSKISNKANTEQFYYLHICCLWYFFGESIEKSIWFCLAIVFFEPTPIENNFRFSVTSFFLVESSMRWHFTIFHIIQTPS